MTTTDSTKFIEAWAQAWSSPNGLEKLCSLFTDDCVYEDLGTGTLARGKEELKDFFEAVFRAIPDFKVELTSHFVAGNWAGAEWTWSGTQTGDFPGIPATNKYACIRAASVFELQGNKFKRCSDYWDMATYLRQAGLMPSK
jgi:steroid delta-isomerase-like uncharacterized protein